MTQVKVKVTDDEIHVNFSSQLQFRRNFKNICQHGKRHHFDAQFRREMFKQKFTSFDSDGQGRLISCVTLAI